MPRKYEDFSFRLNKLMTQKNISSSMLCEKADISRQSLSQYLCGSRLPHAQALVNLSDALEVSIDYLLTGKEKGGIINPDGLTEKQISYLTETAEIFSNYNKIISKRTEIENELYRVLNEKITSNSRFNKMNKYIILDYNEPITSQIKDVIKNALSEQLEKPVAKIIETEDDPDSSQNKLNKSSGHPDNQINTQR